MNDPEPFLSARMEAKTKSSFVNYSLEQDSVYLDPTLLFLITLLRTKQLVGNVASNAVSSVLYAKTASNPGESARGTTSVLSLRSH